MGRTAGELLGSLSSAELTEWLAYMELEPFGEERMDWRFGMLCSIVSNIMRGKDDPVARPADFVPDFAGDRDRGPATLTAEETREALRSLTDGGPGRKGGTLA